MNNAFGQFSDEALAEFRERRGGKRGGCLRGFRPSGYRTIAGERRQVCRSVSGNIKMTVDGIML
jgi:hypothetical protein